MVVYEKIYFKAYSNDLYISYKNNIAQLYFILGRAELRWNFSSILKGGLDIHIHLFASPLNPPLSCEIRISCH